VLARGRRNGGGGGGPRPPGASAGGAGQNSNGGGGGGGDVPLAVYMHDELACLLMEWVQAVCGRWGVAVRNFTTAFGDGRVLCLLVRRRRWGARGRRVWARAAGCSGARLSGEGPPVRAEASVGRRSCGPPLAASHKRPSRPLHPRQVAYYLPNALDVAAVYCPDADAERAAAAADFEALAGGLSSDERLAPGGWCALFDAGGCVRDGSAERHRAGVARNFAAAHRAARSLGAVPQMLSAGDWAEHGPDERAVLLYVAFLCARLLETSREDRAAHVLQSAWREARARRAGEAARGAGAVCLEIHSRGTGPRSAQLLCGAPTYGARALPCLRLTATNPAPNRRGAHAPAVVGRRGGRRPAPRARVAVPPRRRAPAGRRARDQGGGGRRAGGVARARGAGAAGGPAGEARGGGDPHPGGPSRSRGRRRWGLDVCVCRSRLPDHPWHPALGQSLSRSLFVWLDAPPPPQRQWRCAGAVARRTRAALAVQSAWRGAMARQELERLRW
jgi:hypothetical protein